MSGYNAAMLASVDAMTGASADAAYEAAYGKYYTAASGMRNAANKRSAAEANIAAITQDRINTNRTIAMHQDQAEAQAKVAAAVSGVEGQSVEAAIYQTEINSSVAQANNRKNMEQQIEEQLASVYSSTSTMLAVDNPDVQAPSLGMALAEGATTFLTSHGPELMDGMDSLFGSEGGSDMGLGETLTFDAQPMTEEQFLPFNQMNA